MSDSQRYPFNRRLLGQIRAFFVCNRVLIYTAPPPPTKTSSKSCIIICARRVTWNYARTVFLKWDFHLCVNINLLKSFLLNIFESLSSLYHGNYLLLYQNQPINKSINQSISQPIDQSIKSTNWEINQPAN